MLLSEKSKPTEAAVAALKWYKQIISPLLPPGWPMLFHQILLWTSLHQGLPAQLLAFAQARWCVLFPQSRRGVDRRLLDRRGAIPGNLSGDFRIWRVPYPRVPLEIDLVVQVPSWEVAPRVAIHLELAFGASSSAQKIDRLRSFRIPVSRARYRFQRCAIKLILEPGGTIEKTLLDSSREITRCNCLFIEKTSYKQVG